MSDVKVKFCMFVGKCEFRDNQNICLMWKDFKELCNQQAKPYLQINNNGVMQVVLLRHSDIKLRHWIEELGKTELPEQTDKHNDNGVR